MLTVRVRQTLHHIFCQEVLLGCFAIFSFAFCSCLLIFCFRPLSLSFLPLSPIPYLSPFPFSLIFSRGRRCIVSSVLAYFHEFSCVANNNYVEAIFSLMTKPLGIFKSSRSPYNNMPAITFCRIILLTTLYHDPLIHPLNDIRSVNYRISP